MGKRGKGHQCMNRHCQWSSGSILNQQRSDEMVEVYEREVKTGERVGGRGNREG